MGEGGRTPSPRLVDDLIERRACAAGEVRVTRIGGEDGVAALAAVAGGSARGRLAGKATAEAARVLRATVLQVAGPFSSERLSGVASSMSVHEAGGGHHDAPGEHGDVQRALEQSKTRVPRNA